MTFDHGELNIPNRHKNLDAEITRNVKAARAEKTAAHKTAVKQRREEEAARVRLTREDIEGATHVHDGYGWYRVICINQKTVKVAGKYGMGDYAIAIDQIRKTATQQQ